NLLFHQAIDRMVAPGFKRLCCFPASELPARNIAVKWTVGAPVGRTQRWLFSAKFLARKGHLRGETLEASLGLKAGFQRPAVASSGGQVSSVMGADRQMTVVSSPSGASASGETKNRFEA